MKLPAVVRHIADAADLTRLPKAQRRIVFYSEGKTYWVHLKGLLQTLLAISDLPLCYVSSGADDPGLTYSHPQLRCFKIDEGAVRNWLFETIDCELMVMTMPDLHQYQVKRSKHPVRYVYVQHSLVSMHMVYRSGAFDHYDTIFCAGPHHLIEMQALAEQRQFKPKHLVKHGYARLDSIIGNAQPRQSTANSRPHILVAPSWGEHSISETLGGPLIDALLAQDFQVTFRPHPQTVKFAGDKVQAIHYKHHADARFTLEVDVASEDSLHHSDLMICDWSGAALDYAFGLEKPVLFIDVPRKVNNPDYAALDIQPFEVAIREQLGGVLASEDISQVGAAVAALLAKRSGESLASLRAQSVFNVGACDRAGAEALLALL